jgi:O-methyltransferase involved in polyketide biosynthesis
MRRYRFMSGEELIFGIDESKLKVFLKGHGFRHVQNMDANALRRAYFTGKNAGRTIVSGYGIALAEI